MRALKHIETMTSVWWIANLSINQGSLFYSLGSLSLDLLACMALADVDALSDEETVRLSPNAGVREANKKEAREKAKAKAKSSPKQDTKEVLEDGPQPSAKSKGGPGVMKKPSSKRAASAESAGEPAMKKPAASKDLDRVRVNKSMYKKNGVWSIKLNDKEVVRVIGMHRVVIRCWPMLSCFVFTAELLQVKPHDEVKAEETEIIAVSSAACDVIEPYHWTMSICL